jgi:hypothetical protein
MELWKEIEGFPGYMVSNLGRVKSLMYGKEQILKPSFTEKKYLQVGLHKEKKRYCYRVHRLVIETFLPNPENKTEVDHINRNKQDNRIENLRWATHSENVLNRDMPFGVLKERHIHPSGNAFKVHIHRQGLKVYKSFKTLTEAIAFRDLIISTL